MADIARVLTQYEGRFRYLDVFALDVEDLRETSWRQQAGDLVADVQDQTIRVERLSNGVLRLSLVPRAAGVAAGGAIGALLGGLTGGQRGALGGMVLGMLVGAMTQGQQPQMNRVMALRYDPEVGRWLLYDGPLLRWAKEQLVPRSA